ncbi:hypothetical protein GN958_ATG23687 [Phytophthora infestans]|uniref:Uncharacterized protein n=1 Tax=Phytophthora infestans TaxID=4787 RepID=A0A8S9TK35_PHYIN|nr:hypothetical protein GN958_ATG23687 [Phytophthora infestans]
MGVVTEGPAVDFVLDADPDFDTAVDPVLAVDPDLDTADPVLDGATDPALDAVDQVLGPDPDFDAAAVDPVLDVDPDLDTVDPVFGRSNGSSLGRRGRLGSSGGSRLGSGT